MLELLKQCIPTADDPSRYRTVPQQGYLPRKQALEYQLLESAMLQTSWRDLLKAHPDTWSVQGIYLFTPSGILLAGSNHPLNVEINLKSLRTGLEAYARMPRADRLLARAPDPEKDRIFDKQARPRPPVDGLVLRVVGRGLEENIHEFCQLRPKYYLLDRLWYTQEEALQFLPDTLRVGQKKELTGPVVNGLAQLHLIARGAYFHHDDVKELRLCSEVIETTGAAVKLKLSGRAVLEADDMWTASKYRSDLLGSCTYDTQKRRFTHFELLAYGMHNLGKVDMKQDGPDHIPMAFLFTLNGANVNDQQVPTKLDAYRFVNLKAGNKQGTPFR